IDVDTTAQGGDAARVEPPEIPGLEHESRLGIRSMIRCNRCPDRIGPPQRDAPFGHDDLGCVLFGIRPYHERGAEIFGDAARRMDAEWTARVEADLEVRFAVEVHVAAGFAVVGGVAELTLRRQSDLRTITQVDDRAMPDRGGDLTPRWRAPQYGPAADYRDDDRCGGNHRQMKPPRHASPPERFARFRPGPFDTRVRYRLGCNTPDEPQIFEQRGVPGGGAFRQPFPHRPGFRCRRFAGEVAV